MLEPSTRMNHTPIVDELHVISQQPCCLITMRDRRMHVSMLHWWLIWLSLVSFYGAKHHKVCYDRRNVSKYYFQQWNTY